MTGIQQLDSVLAGLLRARDILSDEARWLRENLTADDRVCLVGAAKLGTDCHMDEWNPLALNVMENLELEIALSPWRGRCYRKFVAAANFNDHPKTTHADVLALLDAAIEKRSAVLARA